MEMRGDEVPPPCSPSLCGNGRHASSRGKWALTDKLDIRQTDSGSALYIYFTPERLESRLGWGADCTTEDFLYESGNGLCGMKRVFSR